jgi:signal transduction histidine kinase
VVATSSPTSTRALAQQITANVTLLSKQPILHTSETIAKDLGYIQLSADKFTRRLEQVYAAQEKFDDRVIHELRSPLSVMVGYLELIQESLGAEVGLNTVDSMTINLIDDVYQDSLRLCSELEKHYKR